MTTARDRHLAPLYSTSLNLKLIKDWAFQTGLIPDTNGDQKLIGPDQDDNFPRVYPEVQDGDKSVKHADNFLDSFRLPTSSQILKIFPNSEKDNHTEDGHMISSPKMEHIAASMNTKDAEENYTQEINSKENIEEDSDSSEGSFGEYCISGDGCNAEDEVRSDSDNIENHDDVIVRNQSGDEDGSDSDSNSEHLNTVIVRNDSDDESDSDSEIDYKKLHRIQKSIKTKGPALKRVTFDLDESSRGRPERVYREELQNESPRQDRNSNGTIYTGNRFKENNSKDSMPNNSSRQSLSSFYFKRNSQPNEDQNMSKQTDIQPSYKQRQSGISQSYQAKQPETLPFYNQKQPKISSTKEQKQPEIPSHYQHHQSSFNANPKPWSSTKNTHRSVKPELFKKSETQKTRF